MFADCYDEIFYMVFHNYWTPRSLSLSAVTHAPFMRQCWGLLHKLAQCTKDS